MPQLSCKKKKCENWSLTPHEYVQNKEKHFLEGSSRDCLNDIKYSCPACQFSKSTLLSFVLQGEEFGLGHSCYCQLSSAQRLTAKCEPQVWRERELRQFRTILVLLIDLLWPSVRTMPEVNILCQNILKLEVWGPRGALTSSWRPERPSRPSGWVPRFDPPRISLLDLEAFSIHFSISISIMIHFHFTFHSWSQGIWISQL